MPSAPVRAKLLQFLPGAAGHPEAALRRRLVVGVLVITLTAALQIFPGLFRGASTPTIALRVAFFLVEMLTLAVAVSAIYNRSLERRRGSGRALASTLLVGGCVGLIFLVLFRFLADVFPTLRASGEPRIGYLHAAIIGIFVGFLHCGVWALAFVYPYAADDARLRALEGDKLRIEAEQLKSAAELSRLRSQLEPHFLLNTLNAIAGLVTEDPREARRLLACLGDLLRDSLRDADELQPLDDEIAWLRRYAQILESRHSGTLEFRWEIENAASRALVPRLLLQPLVENAVKHGALRRRDGGRVVVSARVEGANGSRRVVCAIEDNGPGLPRSEPRPGAFGLKSVRRRLALRFPDAKLAIESSKDGTRSVVDLPCLTTRDVA
jgi:signal transduction histidine kinase